MKIYMINFLYFLILVLSLNNLTFAMEKKPYHHLSDGTFRNPEGSPKRDPNVKWSYKIFNQEKKKLDMTISEGHVLEKNIVLRNLEKYKDNDYIAWIGHATFIIKLGDTTIITDPVFSKNAGPLIFGPKRFTEPALKLSEIPNIDLFLLTHNHYDHQDMMTIRRFPYKDSKVLVPLKLSKYFKTNGYRDINEMDWYDEININKNLKVTFLPAVHWSKRSLTDTTIMPYKDKSIYHTNPEEALKIGRDLKSKKVLGMHWGTFVLSLEPIMEPPIRFKDNAENYGFNKEDALIFKIGQISKISDIIN